MIIQLKPQQIINNNVAPTKKSTSFGRKNASSQGKQGADIFAIAKLNAHMVERTRNIVKNVHIQIDEIASQERRKKNKKPKNELKSSENNKKAAKKYSFNFNIKILGLCTL